MARVHDELHVYRRRAGSLQLQGRLALLSQAMTSPVLAITSSSSPAAAAASITNIA